MNNIIYGTLDPYYGQQVRVYWNLHKKVFSIQAKVDGRWKVVRHAAQIDLLCPSFTVSQPGCARVRKEGRKNVHAFMIGTLAKSTNSDVLARPIYGTEYRVAYDPYIDSTFKLLVRDGEELYRIPVTEAWFHVRLVQTDIREGRPTVHAYT